MINGDDGPDYPQHLWGDESFDWEGLYDAGIFISKTCRRYARLGIYWKEKYGTLRATPWFWSGGLHQMVYPGYLFRQWPKNKLGDILWHLDIVFWPRLFLYTGVLKLVLWWQKKVYGYAYAKAVKAFPHLREEILVDADWPELIPGGEEVHGKYWTKLE